jgi:hypothetical protein
MNLEVQDQDQDRDPEVRAAYERLGSALAPPLDVLARVDRRIRERRRHRVAAVAAAAVVALGSAGAAVALSLGDGDSTGSLVTDDPAGPADTLSITRTDGSTYTFHDVTVTCAPDDKGGQVLEARSPRRFRGEQLLEPFVLFAAPLDTIADGRSFELPVDGMDEGPMTLFFATDEGGPRANELSSAQSPSSGTVQVLGASCGPTPSLHLKVDATLGSEVEQPPMRIVGELR